jgi:hypothetical protein
MNDLNDLLGIALMFAATAFWLIRLQLKGGQR